MGELTLRHAVCRSTQTAERSLNQLGSGINMELALQRAVARIPAAEPRTIVSKPGLLTLTIKDKSALYLAYMPFIKNGGLFIPTNSSYKLGDEVFMLLNVMGEEEKIPVAGRVIWITPKGAQGKRTAGIGVQFSEQDQGNTQKQDRELSRGRPRRRQAHAHALSAARLAAGRCGSVRPSARTSESRVRSG